MPTWLAIVLGVFVLLVVVLAVGGIVGRRRQLERHARPLRLRASRQVNRELAAAHAERPRLGARGPRDRRARGLRRRARRRAGRAHARPDRRPPGHRRGQGRLPRSGEERLTLGRSGGELGLRERCAVSARLPRAALTPVELGPVTLRQPRRLDVAPDRAGARAPADGRPARLPRRPRPRRRRGDLPRGDGGRPDRPADRRTRSAASCRAIVPGYARLADAVHEHGTPPASSSSSTAAASRSPRRRARPRWRRRPCPRRASRASRAR